MNNTPQPMPRCQMRRMKSDAARLSGHLVTHHAVFRQPVMPLNGACRRLSTFFRSYAVLSFMLFSIVVPFLKEGSLHCAASIAPPAEQDRAAGPASDALNKYMPGEALPGGPDAAPSRADVKPAEQVHTSGVEKQQSSLWSRGIGSPEGSPDYTHLFRLPASASSLAAPWTPTGAVLPAYLLFLEQELRSALRKISPMRWRLVALASLRCGSLFCPLGSTSPVEGVQQGGARHSSAQYSLGEASMLPGIRDSMGLPWAWVTGIENRPQGWQSVLQLEQVNAYDSNGVPSHEASARKVKSAVQQVPPTVAQEHGYMGIAPFDQVLTRRVRKTVQHMLDDIIALSQFQQLVSDFRARLQYYYQAEQQLRQRLACLATPDTMAEKHEGGHTAGQPDEGACAGFEKYKNEDERRAQRLAVEKELNDVRQAAEDASRLFFTIISRSEFDTTIEGRRLPLLAGPLQQLLAAASPNRFEGLPYAEPLKNAHTADTRSPEEVPQPLLHMSQLKPEKGVTPGQIPRSLASMPPPPSSQAYTQDMIARSQSLQRTWKPTGSPLYAPQQAYQCFKLTPEGHVATSGVLTCECRRENEAQDTVLLESLLCSKVKRANGHRHRLPVVEQPVECYPATSHELTALVQPSPSVVRQEYMVSQPRQTVVATEPSIQCQCFKPRAHYECRRAVPRLVQREPIRIVPEVVESRATEQVVAPVDCEIIQRQQAYAPPPPVPETVLVPCECIEHSVAVPEAYYTKQDAEMYGSRDPFMIPMECIVKSTQLERVPCECIARRTGHAPVPVMGVPSSEQAFAECICPTDEFNSYALPAYPSFDMPE